MANYDPKELTIEAQRLLRRAAIVVLLWTIFGVLVALVEGVFFYFYWRTALRAEHAIALVFSVLPAMITVAGVYAAAREKARMLRLQAQQLLALVAVNDQVTRTQRYLERLYDEMRAR